MADDYAGSTATTGVVSVGGSVTGNFESTNDDDWFRVTLTAGRIYQFDLQGSDTGQGTLTDPNMRLRDSGGSSIALDFDSGVGSNARITFAASASGTYYLSFLRSSLLGTYKLSATDLGPGSDDYAGSAATTGIVSVGGSVTGNIESTNDDDWFRVTLTAGRIYQFDLEGSDTGQGTLTDPNMRLRDSGGSSIALDFDSGGGQQRAHHLRSFGERNVLSVFLRLLPSRHLQTERNRYLGGSEPPANYHFERRWRHSSYYSIREHSGNNHGHRR